LERGRLQVGFVHDAEDASAIIFPVLCHSRS
jgi:hypothetical protein